MGQQNSAMSLFGAINNLTDANFDQILWNKQIFILNMVASSTVIYNSKSDQDGL